MFKKQSLSFLVIAGLLSGYALAADEELLSRMSVKQRLERLENIIGSDILMEQSRQLDALLQEVSMLREMLEEKDYQLEEAQLAPAFSTQFPKVAPSPAILSYIPTAVENRVIWESSAPWIPVP